MCGIFAVLNSKGYMNQSQLLSIREGFIKGKNRGPEKSNFEQLTPNILFGNYIYFGFLSQTCSNLMIRGKIE